VDKHHTHDAGIHARSRTPRHLTDDPIGELGEHAGQCHIGMRSLSDPSATIRVKPVP